MPKQKQSMNTILYIGDTYICSLEQLRKCVLDAFSNEGRQDTIREIETLFRDGVLQRWLEEGGSEEKALAREFNAVNHDADSSKLRERIALVLTDEFCRVKRNVDEYLRIEKKTLYADGMPLTTLDAVNNCEMPAECRSLKIVMQCRVLKVEAETFVFDLSDKDKKIIDKYTVDLRQYVEGQLIDIVLEDTDVSKVDSLKLYVDIDNRQILYVPIVRFGDGGFAVNRCIWVSRVVVEVLHGGEKVGDKSVFLNSDMYMLQHAINDDDTLKINLQCRIKEDMTTRYSTIFLLGYNDKKIGWPFVLPQGHYRKNQKFEASFALGAQNIKDPCFVLDFCMTSMGQEVNKFASLTGIKK